MPLKKGESRKVFSSNVKELLPKFQTKGKLEQKFAVQTDIDQDYINDWDPGRETGLFHMKTCELYNFNQKFCNTIWY